MIIAFHNWKGGIGSTTLAAHFCSLAKAAGHAVAGVSIDFKKDLPRYLQPEGIPCIELDPQRDEPDFDLLVMDVQSSSKPPMCPDVYIVPICDRTSNESAASLTDSLIGPVIWIANKGRERLQIPTYLRSEIITGPPIPYSRAVEIAGFDNRIVWSVPELADSAGAHSLHAALRDLLTCVSALVKGASPDDAGGADVQPLASVDPSV